MGFHLHPHYILRKQFVWACTQPRILANSIQALFERLNSAEDRLLHSILDEATAVAVMQDPLSPPSRFPPAQKAGRTGVAYSKINGSGLQFGLDAYDEMADTIVIDDGQE